VTEHLVQRDHSCGTVCYAMSPTFVPNVFQNFPPQQHLKHFLNTITEVVMQIKSIRLSVRTVNNTMRQSINQ